MIWLQTDDLTALLQEPYPELDFSTLQWAL